MIGKSINVLLCEDDESFGMLLRDYLKVKEFNTDLCVDGESGYEAFTQNQYDICLLDVMMPKKDGLTLASEIRAANSEVPIILLTAKNLKDDIIDGFRHGCDDYITKPFSMEELLCRMEAVLRRAKIKRQSEKGTYVFGKYTFDSQKQQLSFADDDEVVKLTTKESDLLSLLCMHMNEILERNITLRTIWIDDNYFNARSMDVYIAKLRKLFAKDKTVQIINIHGKGYKLVAASAKRVK